MVGLSLPTWAQDDTEEEDEPELSAEESAPPTVSDSPLVHLSGGGVADALSKQIGFELSVSYGASRYWDVGLGVDFGASIGAVALEESYFILDEVTDILLRNPQIQQLRIEGHTDDVGGAEFNEELSTQRALSVSRYLSDRGVDPTRLQGQGFGLTKPLARNKTEAGRKKNRRVQFRIVAPSLREKSGVAAFPAIV